MLCAWIQQSLNFRTGAGNMEDIYSMYRSDGVCGLHDRVDLVLEPVYVYVK